MVYGDAERMVAHAPATGMPTIKRSPRPPRALQILCRVILDLSTPFLIRESYLRGAAPRGSRRPLLRRRPLRSAIPAWPETPGPGWRLRRTESHRKRGPARAGPARRPARSARLPEWWRPPE